MRTFCFKACLNSFHLEEILRAPVFTKAHSPRNISSRQSSWIAAPKSRQNKPSVLSPSYYRTTSQTHSFTFSGSEQKRRKWPYKSLSLALLAGAGITYGLYEYLEAGQGLTKDGFSPFILEAKTQVSSTSSILTVRPLLSKPPIDLSNTSWQRAVVSVQAKQPQLQIARSYTPLLFLSGSHEASDKPTLQFLVRHEPNGEMSGYLSRLPFGASVYLREPNVEYELPKKVDRILFLAGGTGIAPALQVAHILSGPSFDDGSKPVMHILWANKKPEDCVGGVSSTPTKEASRLRWWSFFNKPWSREEIEQDGTSPIVAELNRYQASFGEHFKVDYFVDEQNFITSDALRSIVALKDQDSAKSQGKGLILLSGPDGFINHFAGPKVWKNSKEMQGPLGGVLGDLAMDGWDVWKL